MGRKPLDSTHSHTAWRIQRRWNKTMAATGESRSPHPVSRSRLQKHTRASKAGFRSHSVWFSMFADTVRITNVCIIIIIRVSVLFTRLLFSILTSSTFTHRHSLIDSILTTFSGTCRNCTTTAVNVLTVPHNQHKKCPQYRLIMLHAHTTIICSGCRTQTANTGCNMARSMPVTCDSWKMTKCQKSLQINFMSVILLI